MAKAVVQQNRRRYTVDNSLKEDDSAEAFKCKRPSPHVLAQKRDLRLLLCLHWWGDFLRNDSSTGRAYGEHTCKAYYTEKQRADGHGLNPLNNYYHILLNHIIQTGGSRYRAAQARDLFANETQPIVRCSRCFAVPGNTPQAFVFLNKGAVSGQLKTDGSRRTRLFCNEPEAETPAHP